MSKYRKLFQKAQQSPQNLRFEEACLLAEAFGFRYRGGKGSHRIFSRPEVDTLLNFQNVGGKAKPYQVKQLLKAVEEFGLNLED